MDPSGFKPWLDIAVSYGVPLVITFGVLILLWKYVPAWIESSIKIQTQVPIELAKLNDTLREGAKDMHQIKQAVKHGAKASARMMKLTNADPEAAREMREMLKALGDGEDE